MTPFIVEVSGQRVLIADPTLTCLTHEYESIFGEASSRFDEQASENLKRIERCIEAHIDAADECFKKACNIIDAHPELLPHGSDAGSSADEGDTPMPSSKKHSEKVSIGTEGQVDARRGQDVPNYEDELAKSRPFGWGVGHFEDGSSIADMSDDIFFDHAQSLVSRESSGAVMSVEEEIKANGVSKDGSDHRTIGERASLESSNYNSGPSDRSGSPLPGKLRRQGTNIYSESVTYGGEKSPFGNEFEVGLHRERFSLLKDDISEESSTVELATDSDAALQRMNEEIVELQDKLFDCQREKNKILERTMRCARAQEQTYIHDGSVSPIKHADVDGTRLLDGQIEELSERIADVRRKIFGPARIAADVRSGRTDITKVHPALRTRSLFVEMIRITWRPPSVQEANDSDEYLGSKVATAVSFVLFLLDGRPTLKWSERSPRTCQIARKDEGLGCLDYDKMKLHLLERFESHKAKEVRKRQEVVRETCREDDKPRSTAKGRWGKLRFRSGKEEITTPTRAEKKQAKLKGDLQPLELPTSVSSSVNIPALYNLKADSPTDDGSPPNEQEDESDVHCNLMLDLWRWLCLLDGESKERAVAVEYWAQVFDCAWRALQEQRVAADKHRALWIASRWVEEQGDKAKGRPQPVGAILSSAETVQSFRMSTVSTGTDEYGGGDWESVFTRV